MCLPGKEYKIKYFRVTDVIRRFKIHIFKESFFFLRIGHKSNLSGFSP